MLECYRHSESLTVPPTTTGTYVPRRSSMILLVAPRRTYIGSCRYHGEINIIITQSWSTQPSQRLSKPPVRPSVRGTLIHYLDSIHGPPTAATQGVRSCKDPVHGTTCGRCSVPSAQLVHSAVVNCQNTSRHFGRTDADMLSFLQLHDRLSASPDRVTIIIAGNRRVSLRYPITTLRHAVRWLAVKLGQ